VCIPNDLTGTASTPMHRIVKAIVVMICASAIGGCITAGQSRPPSNHAYLDMYDRPPPEQRKASLTVSQSKPAEPTTVGSTSGPVEYSPEWWAQERAREARENERLKRVMRICEC